MPDYTAAEKARSDYLANIQQQAANVAEHGKALKQEAPARIGKATQLAKAAKVETVLDQERSYQAHSCRGAHAPRSRLLSAA